MYRPPVTTTASLDDFLASGWKAICDKVEADYFTISEALRTAAVEANTAGEHARSKVLWLLGDICALHLEASNLNEPYRETVTDNGRPFGIDDLEDADVDLLMEACPEVDHDLVRARVADILWLHRRSRHIRHALAAIEAYRLAPLDAEAWFMRDTSSSWHRGIVLALQVRTPAQTLLREMQTDLLAAVAHQLDGGDAAPSMIGLLLDRGLATDQASSLAEQLAARAQRQAATDEGNRFFVTRNYLGLAKQCFTIARNVERAADMDCDISQSFCDEAAFRISGEHRSYFVAAEFYAEAIQALLAMPKAQRASRNIDERLRSLTQTQRDTAKQSVGDFVPMIGQSTDIDEDAKNARDAIAGQELTDALRTFTEIVSIASRPEAEATARKLLSMSFLRRAISSVRIADDGRVVARSAAADSDGDSEDFDEALWAKMVECQQRRIRFLTESAIVPALQQVHLEHLITLEDLSNIVGQSGTVPAVRVELVAKGLKAGFEGDFIVALHLLVPQLEHFVRTHLQHYGEKTTGPGTDGLQMEVGLSSLTTLHGMEQVFGVDVTFEIRALFCDRFGPNLRNELAHGLLDPGPLQSAESIYAWWFIFKLIYGQYWYRDE